MSILNAWVERHRALIGVDTEAARGTERGIERSQVAKMVPLVHLNAVIAGRGAIEFMSSLANHCQLSGASFDQLLSMFSQSLAEMESQVHQAVARGFEAVTGRQLPAFPEHQEIVLVGWSRGSQRFEGRAWTRTIEGYVANDIAPDHIGVWDESLAKFPQPSSPLSMKRLASAQVELLRTHEPGVGAGGDFIVAELEPERMMIHNLGQLFRQEKSWRR